MQSFASKDLTRSPREVTLAAEHGPVAITQHRKARYVLMTLAHYEELSARAEDPRRVFRASEVPDDLKRDLVAALDDQIRDEDRPDGQ